jgi:hypothetical protein
VFVPFLWMIDTKKNNKKATNLRLRMMLSAADASLRASEAANEAAFRRRKTS